MLRNITPASYMKVAKSGKTSWKDEKSSKKVDWHWHCGGGALAILSSCLLARQVVKNGNLQGTSTVWTILMMNAAKVKDSLIAIAIWIWKFTGVEDWTRPYNNCRFFFFLLCCAYQVSAELLLLWCNGARYEKIFQGFSLYSYTKKCD